MIKDFVDEVISYWIITGMVFVFIMLYEVHWKGWNPGSEDTLLGRLYEYLVRYSLIAIISLFWPVLLIYGIIYFLMNIYVDFKLGRDELGCVAKWVKPHLFKHGVLVLGRHKSQFRDEIVIVYGKDYFVIARCIIGNKYRIVFYRDKWDGGLPPNRWDYTNSEFLNISELLPDPKMNAKEVANIMYEFCEVNCAIPVG